MSFGYWVSRIQFKSTNQAKYCCMVVDNDNRLLSDAYDTFDTLSMKNSRFSIIMCYKQNSRIMEIVYHKILKIYLNLIRMSLLNIWPTQLKTMLMRIFLVLKICPVFISEPFIFFRFATSFSDLSLEFSKLLLFFIATLNIDTNPHHSSKKNSV